MGDPLAGGLDGTPSPPPSPVNRPYRNALSQKG